MPMEEEIKKGQTRLWAPVAGQERLFSCEDFGGHARHRGKGRSHDEGDEGPCRGKKTARYVLQPGEKHGGAGMC